MLEPSQPSQPRPNIFLEVETAKNKAGCGFQRIRPNLLTLFFIFRRKKMAIRKTGTYPRHTSPADVGKKDGEVGTDSLKRPSGAGFRRLDLVFKVGTASHLVGTDSPK